MSSFGLQFDEEIARVVPKWKWLRTQSSGSICRHELRMLLCLLKDSEYKRLPLAQQNQLKWVVLLHDIAKKGLPSTPRDYAHAYTSGIETLNVLCGLYGVTSACSGTLSRIKTAQAALEGSITDKGQTNLKNLGTILARAGEALGPASFSFIVFKLVVMHQSVRTLREFQYPSWLSDAEIRQHCDTQFLRLLQIVMSNDSISYLIKNPAAVSHICKGIAQAFARYLALVHQPTAKAPAV